MATTAREQLIADWRERLAAAEATPVGESKRLAWLVRVRIRLYRFLLSLYSDADWNAAPPPPAATPHDSSVIFDCPNVLPLAGKPAKSEGNIRAVLKAVAGAQDESQARGPWVDGLAEKEWVVVVAPSNNLDPARCIQLLDNKGIVNRWSEAEEEVAILVPAPLVPRAQAIISAHAYRLKRPPPPKRVPPPSPESFWILLSIALAPLLAGASLLIASTRYPDAAAKNETGEFLLYSAAIFAALFALAFVRPISWLVLILERLTTASVTRLYRMCIPKRPREPDCGTDQ